MACRRRRQLPDSVNRGCDRAVVEARFAPNCPNCLGADSGERERRGVNGRAGCR